MVTALLAVVVLLIGATLWITSSSATKAPLVKSRLVAASLGTMRQSVVTTGTIEPAVQDSLDFTAPGLVTSVAVAAGDPVRAGEVLATIDPEALTATLAQAQATLANDQAKVAADENSSATSTQLAADQASVTVAQAQVASATSALAGASLTSPIAGVVASVNLQTGQQVSGSSGSGGSGTGSSTATASNSSSAAIVVIATNSWVVDTTVDDTQVGLIAKGNQAQLTTPGAASTSYGTVASIGIVASTSSGTASYPVVVNVTGNPGGMHAGASATVALIYRQLTNVLTVPLLAVHVSNGKSIVYEQSGTTQVARPVTTGLASGGEVQILSGLTAGEQVVVNIPVPAGSVPRRTGKTGTGKAGGGKLGGGKAGGGKAGGGKLGGGGGLSGG